MDKRMLSFVIACAMLLTFVSTSLTASAASIETMPAEVQEGMEEYGDFCYRVLKNGTVEISDYIGSGTVENIPDKIEGRAVTSIGEKAFAYCSTLTSITIPNSVKSIGKSAFYTCKGLKSISIPNSVTSIGKYAFYKCVELESITIPNSVTIIEEDVFRECTGLKSVDIPYSVKIIDVRAFFDCLSLKSITIPKTVKSIRQEAIGYCWNTSLYSEDDETIPTNLIIYGCKGSAAEMYARKYIVKFIEIEDVGIPDMPDTPDTPDTPDKPEADNPSSDKTIYHGNIDGDEVITAVDALMTLRAAVKLEKFSDKQNYYADVNGDCKVDSSDSLAILRYSVGFKDDGLTIGFSE